MSGDGKTKPEAPEEIREVSEKKGDVDMPPELAPVVSTKTTKSIKNQKRNAKIRPTIVSDCLAALIRRKEPVNTGKILDVTPKMQQELEEFVKENV